MNKTWLFIFLFVFVGCNQSGDKSSFLNNLSSKEESNFIETLLLYSYKSPELNDFYKSQKYKNLWTSEDKRKIILEELKNSNQEGLTPSDYDIENLVDYEQKIKLLNPRDISNYDISLTYNLQKYLSNLAFGKINPMKLYDNFDISPDKFDVYAYILNLLNSEKSLLKKQIEDIKPTHGIYKSLKEALSIIDSLPDDKELKKIKFARKIKPLRSHPALIDIKQRLIYWKYLPQSTPLTEDYTKETLFAIKQFQENQGFVPDGIIGRETGKALNVSKENRRKQIVVNLERWRWYPRDFGNSYIVVNIPEYKLTLVKNNDTIRQHKVIVGRIERQTPVLTSVISTVIFNPTWTIPKTILTEDIVPEILKDENYLSNSNISIYDRKGRKVSLENWSSSSANNYRYVQNAGTNNTLGNVKLPFNNRFSVYLHDTNHRDSFGQNTLSLSSGCVRIENPIILIQSLFEDSNWTEKRISSIIKKETTRYINIPKTNIMILYWTAWSKNKQLNFRNDIYNKDSELYYLLNN